MQPDGVRDSQLLSLLEVDLTRGFRNVLLEKERQMFFRTKSYFISWVILAVVMVLTAGHASSQETIQAQAFGTSTMAGKTFGITITIEEYSTGRSESSD